MDIAIFDFINSFSMPIILLIIVALFFTLSKGADILVDEAVSLSIKWGVPKMILGATIVSLGTTLPEATVSVLAAVNKNPDLALGNAIGSIIVDTGLIIGLCAILGKLPIDKLIVTRQGKIQIGAGILLTIASLPFLSKGVGGNISQFMGFIFIALLLSYIFLSIKWTKNCASSDCELTEEKSPMIIQFLKLLSGIVLVIVSSKLLIPAVEITALRIGIPQSIIAATLIAFGTSLPELVTSVTAVRKGHGELAVGNIVGADILNVLFVVGSAASVTKGGLQVPSDFYILQIPAMLLILFTFRFFSTRKNAIISKNQGIILLVIYIVYLVLNYILI